jgi:23S rRNA pseudouridine2605 synthase
MRINKFVAQASGISRRAADQAIKDGRVSLNGHPASLGDAVSEADQVMLDGQPLQQSQLMTLMLNKPAGYVCSRLGQGAQTVYDLLPASYHHLKSVGRLDKDSSGLLLLTNDGQLANQLTHPRYAKSKIYLVGLDNPLSEPDQAKIERGIALDDGLSHLTLRPDGSDRHNWQVTMSEGRNRQIRRSFAALGYGVTRLRREQFGDYQLGNLPVGQFKLL